MCVGMCETQPQEFGWGGLRHTKSTVYSALIWSIKKTSNGFSHSVIRLDLDFTCPNQGNGIPTAGTIMNKRICSYSGLIHSRSLLISL